MQVFFPSFVSIVTFMSSTMKWTVSSSLPFHLVATDESVNVTLSEVISQYRIVDSPFPLRSTTDGMDPCSALLPMWRSRPTHAVASHLHQHILFLSILLSFTSRSESYCRGKPAVSESEGCAVVRCGLFNAGSFHWRGALSVSLISWMTESRSPSFHFLRGKESSLRSASGRSRGSVCCSVSGKRWWR